MEDKQLINIMKEFNRWLNKYWSEPNIYKSDILKGWEDITKNVDMREMSPKVKFIIEEKEREMKMKILLEKSKRSNI